MSDIADLHLELYGQDEICIECDMFLFECKCCRFCGINCEREKRDESCLDLEKNQ